MLKALNLYVSIELLSLTKLLEINNFNLVRKNAKKFIIEPKCIEMPIPSIPIIYYLKIHSKIIMPLEVYFVNVDVIDSKEKIALSVEILTNLAFWVQASFYSLLL